MLITQPPPPLLPRKVSSTLESLAKQKGDLEWKKQLLSTRFPSYELISDIGSGVNFKRPGLMTLLERTGRGMVSEIVATHRDRLCQFAFNLIQYVLSPHSKTRGSLQRYDPGYPCDQHCLYLSNARKKSCPKLTRTSKQAKQAGRGKPAQQRHAQNENAQKKLSIVH